jgi:hypothetical protein
MLSAVFLLIALADLDAQTASTAARKFEVASVKRCQNSQSPSGGDLDPGRLHLACVTIANLIRLAYLVFRPANQMLPSLPVRFRCRSRVAQRGSIPIVTASMPRWSSA